MATLGDMILSIRDQIPDPVTDPSLDGTAFSFASLLRWINDAQRIICAGAPVIQDWHGLPSITGMSIYELPQYITSVEQAWYNLLPLTRAPEGGTIYTTKVTSRSWWFGPHSIHATPRLHVWPAPDRTASTSTLTAPLSQTGTTVTVASSTAFNVFGYAQIEQELILFQNKTATAFNNVLRGQSGTLAISHNNGVPITDCNIFFKCYRLPRTLITAADPIELPQTLWPLVELYVQAKVKSAEQDIQESLAIMREFLRLVDRLAEKGPQIKGLRQGMQVKILDPTVELFRGRTIIP